MEQGKGAERGTDALVVLVTVPPGEKGVQLARALVEERLVACVNLLGPIRSIYRWENAVEDEPEALLVCKTTRALFERMRERVVALHPYSCPEVLALNVEAGHPPYLAWLAGAVG